MTYASGQLIAAVDFNNFVNQLNPIWGNGTGDSGYGQTELVLASAGTTATSAAWEEMRDVITRIANHQGTSLVNFPTSGDVAVGSIVDITDWQTNLTNIINARWNYTGSDSSVIALSSTQSTSVWGQNNTSIDAEIDFTFPSVDIARHFFNSGGELRIDPFQATNVNPQDASWAAFLDAGVGIVFMSAIATGRTGPTGTPAASIGYNDLTASYTTIYSGTYGTGAYTSINMTAQASIQSVGAVVRIKVTFNDAHMPTNGSFDQVSAGTGVDVTIRKTDITQLNDIAQTTPSMTVVNSF